MQISQEEAAAPWEELLTQMANTVEQWKEDQHILYGGGIV